MSSHLHPQAKMTPSSIYIPSDALDHSLTLWRMGEVYMVDSTGNTGEPWGVPTVKLKGSDVSPLKRSWTVRSFRKDLHQLVSSGVKPRLAKVWISQSWLILSK